MPHDLGTIQRWLQSVITHPDGVDSGIRSGNASREIPLAPEQLETVIPRSRALSSAERLGVYANAYYARLLECVRSEFPALVHLLGEETFDGFAFGYLQAYPSRSYTLNQLGAQFPRYLAETRPPEDSADDASWSELLIDLATVERTYSEIFDGPGIEDRQTLQPADLLAVPPERWADVRLVPAECLRLLVLRYPVHEYISSVRRGEDPELPTPQPTFLVVTRRNYVVRRAAVAPDEFEVLKSLVSGATLREAIIRAAQSAEGPVESLAENLRGWFRVWASAGYFVRLET